MRKLAPLLLIVGLLLAAPAWGGPDDDDSASAATDAATEASPPGAPPRDPGPGSVLVARLDAHTINRGSREYLLSALETADEDPEIRTLLIVIDTPGGVLEDTRLLVKAMLASQTPIITYVGPTGSRAASAGLFLTMAGHLAVMAPGTHTGSAHPVFLGPGMGEEASEDGSRSTQQAMLDKVTEDTVSFIRNIAALRGRNAEWGERAVRESVSATDDEAVALNIIDYVAVSVAEAVALAEGRVVTTTGDQQVVVRTGPLIEHPRPLRLSVLYLLTEPSIAFLLLLIGVLGIGFEIRMPGLVAPAVIGAVCLMLALFSLSALPVNAVAFLFVVAGAALIVADLFVASYGLLTGGGVVAIAFGGLFLIETTPEVPIGVSPVIVAAAVITAGLLGALAAWLVLGDRQRAVHTGVEGLVGASGRVIQALAGGPDAIGRVFVQSERWQAWSAEPIEEGARVVVRSKDGMVLEVVRQQSGE